MKHAPFALALVVASVVATACWFYAFALAGEPGATWILTNMMGVTQ